MKKISTLFLVALVTTGFMYAGGGWATSAVSITKDGGTAYKYVLNNEGWTDGDWGSNTAVNNYDFGTPTSLVLNGGAGNGWTDDLPGYDATSFVLYYRVYKSDATPGTWSQIVLDFQAYKSGNNYIYDKMDAAVDLMALATLSGTNTYTLEVAMSKNQFYTGGNWNSMVPGGQAVAYSSAVAGYKATFTKSITTGLTNGSDKAVINGNNGRIEAQFAGAATVELYSLTGQLLVKEAVDNQFAMNVNQGIYMLRINGITHKVMVR